MILFRRLNRAIGRIVVIAWKIIHIIRRKNKTRPTRQSNERNSNNFHIFPPFRLRVDIIFYRAQNHRN